MVVTYSYHEYLQRWEKSKRACPIAKGFGRGLFHSTRWDATELSRARTFLCESAGNMNEDLKLMDTTFVNEDCCRELFQLLIQASISGNLRRLTLAVRGQPRLLWLLASSQQLRLDDLTLEIHHHLTEDEASCLTTIADMPRQSLILRFSHVAPQGLDSYIACLQALQQPAAQQEQAENGNTSNGCRVKLENVELSSVPHPRMLKRFARLVDTCNLASLHVMVPRAQGWDDDGEEDDGDDDDIQSTAVAFQWVRVLPLLLTCSSLIEMEIGGAVVLPDTYLDHQDKLLRAMRRAMEGNNVLQRFAIPTSSGLTRLWAQAVFPALTHGSNTTLQRIEFGQEHAVLVDFLQQLPHMRYLTSVQAPWHRRCFSSWMTALEHIDNLQHVDFVFGSPISSTNDSVEYFFRADCPTTTPLRNQIRQCCQRNRLVAAARSFLTQAPQATGVMQKLAEMDDHQQGLGFSAAFVLVRGYAGPLIHL